MAKQFHTEALEKNDPELSGKVQAIQDWIVSDGALPAKVKTLMSMLCDAILGHAEGVAVLAQRARSMGASEQEIAETVRMAFLFGGKPALVTAANAFRTPA